MTRNLLLFFCIEDLMIIWLQEKIHLPIVMCQFIQFLYFVIVLRHDLPQLNGFSSCKSHFLMVGLQLFLEHKDPLPENV